MPAVVVMLGALGFSIFTFTKTLVASGVDAPPPAQPAPDLTPTPETSRSAADCGAAAINDGNSLELLEPEVRAIHDAACRRDYAALIPYMDPVFGSSSREEVVAAWQQEDPSGARLDVLAETLEAPGVGFQGGHIFCHPKGAVAVFPRGTNERPGMWSDFDVTGERLSFLCEATS